MQDIFEDTTKAESNVGAAKRSEIVPKFISTIHKIPKQLVDTLQMVDVSEFMMNQKLPSGVLLSSQVAHDKWLARFDALLDAFIVFVIITLITVTGLNYMTVFFIIVGLWYWNYHILWYAKAREFEISVTSSSYSFETVKVFWQSFVVFSTLMYFIVSSLITTGFTKFLQSVIAHIMHYCSLIITFFSYIGSIIFSDSTIENLSFLQLKESELSETEIKNLVFGNLPEEVTKTPQSVDNSFSLILNRQEVAEMIDKFSIFPNINIFGDFDYAMQIILFASTGIFIYFTIHAKTKYENKYKNKKDAILQDKDRRFRTDLEQKMDVLESL